MCTDKNSGVKQKFANTATNQVVPAIPKPPMPCMNGMMMLVMVSLIPVDAATKPMDMQLTIKNTNLKLMPSMSSCLTTPKHGKASTAGSNTKI